LWNFYCCIYLQDLGGNFTWRFLIEKPLWTPPYVSH
jgi:predicted acyltransferase